MKDLTIGSSLEAEGQFVPGPKGDGSHDFEVSQLRIHGTCDSREYPFKARSSHSLDYLRQFPHLRSRTSTFSAVLRLRHAATMAFHQYFQVCACMRCVLVHVCVCVCVCACVVCVWFVCVCGVCVCMRGVCVVCVCVVCVCVHVHACVWQQALIHSAIILLPL